MSVYLDPGKFKKNEELSNHAVTMFVYPECPIGGKACFGIGMGSPVPACDFFSTEGESALCSNPDMQGDDADGTMQNGEMFVKD